MITTALVRLSRIFIILLFLSPSIFAEPVIAAESSIVTVRPALWLVKNGPGKAYLLGSFHLLPKNYRWYDGLIRQSFKSADDLVLETDITPESMTEIQHLIVKNAFFGSKDNLQNHLDDAHYRKLLSQAASLLRMNAKAVKRSKPWFIALRLSIAAIISTGLDPNAGVDTYIKNQATKLGKPILGFETPREQMLALINHPLKVQVAMLTDTLDKLDDFKSYINSYLGAWASGNPDRMIKTMVNDMAKNKAMYQTLLVNRNKKWLPEIEGYLNKPKTFFIVVGAAHLVGPDGLIWMLREKGYKVVRIQ